jgi:hypothetical protein
MQHSSLWCCKTAASCWDLHRIYVSRWFPSRSSNS